MNYVDVFYQSDDGLRLYARDYPGPEDDAPVIICLPGLTRNSKDFVALAETLQHGYRVICPDQRGRGRSQRDANAAHYRPDRYVQDMCALQEILHISKWTIIGTSLGGLMAMLMMARDGQRIAGVVLNDIGPVVDPLGLARIASYVGKSAPVRNWDEASEQAAVTNALAFPDYDRKAWQAMARELYIQEGTTPVLDYDPAIAVGVVADTAALSLWPLLEAMPALPVLAIRGETSDILSAAILNEMTQRLPHLTAVTVPHRGHAPTLGEPAARAAIMKFLTNINQTPSAKH